MNIIILIIIYIVIIYLYKMPKNTKGGKNTKKQKNSSPNDKIKPTYLPSNLLNEHIGVINKKFGFQQYDITVVSDTGHKGETGNAKAHGKRNLKIEVGQYVLIEYSELNSGTFYITDAYQPQDIEILKQNGLIDNSVNPDKSKNDDIVFGAMEDSDLSMI